MGEQEGRRVRQHEGGRKRIKGRRKRSSKLLMRINKRTIRRRSEALQSFDKILQ